MRRIPIRSVGGLAVVGCVCLGVAYYFATRSPDFADGGYGSIPQTPVESQATTGASLPPGVLQEIREKRHRAWEQLRRSESEGFLPSVIDVGLRDPSSPVAIVRVEGSVPSGSRLTLRLRVERVLRGSLPEAVSAECYLNDLHSQRVTHFKPELGKRILASLAGQDRHTAFYGILNLDDPKEAAWLPQAIAVVSLDEDAARKGLSVYEEALTSPFRAVRDAAMDRLLGGPADPVSGKRILALIRRLLESEDPDDRWNAVSWLAEIGSFVRDCQRPQSPLHARPPFQLKAVRALLAFAEKNSNVVVGDEAFETLASLDFFRKENAERCAAIFPELRTMAFCPKEAGCGDSSNCEIVCVHQEEFR